MTDKLKTYEFRCRGRIRAKSEEDAKAALGTITLLTFPRWLYLEITVDNMELLGEVEGE